MKLFREFLGEESDVFTMYDPELLKKVLKPIQRHFSKTNPVIPDTELRSLTDSELEKIRKSFPANFTDKTTDIERNRVWQIYIEQRYRYEEKKSKDFKKLARQYNEFETTGIWDDGSPFPQINTKVSRFIPTLLGFGGTEISGVVKKRKNGVYYVKTIDPNTGKSIQDRLTKAWRN